MLNKWRSVSTPPRNGWWGPVWIEVEDNSNKSHHKHAAFDGKVFRDAHCGRILHTQPSHYMYVTPPDGSNCSISGAIREEG